MTEPARPRVLLLALDAMEVSFLQELFAAGRLPNLRAFSEQSLSLGVSSAGATLHGSLWPTFASGTGPGVHGVYWWTQWLAEEMRHVRNSHAAFSYEPFWAGLARAGIRSCAIDVPYAPMVQLPQVRQYVGWGIHDEVETASWPAGFGADIRKRYGKHPLSFDTVEPQSLGEKRAMIRDLRKGMAMRARMLEGVLREGTEDLVIATCGETHKAVHYLAERQEIGPSLSNVDAIGDLLTALDEAWPRILDAAGPNCHVMLFALHGITHQVDYANSLAAQLLALANGKEPEAGVAPPDLLRRVRDLMPDSLHRAIWKRLPARIRAARQGNLVEAGGDYSNDALLRIGHDGHLGVRINLRGRERDGIVDAEAGEAAIENLWTIAAEYSATNGLPAFEGLWRSAEHAPGPRQHRLPDALLLTNLAVARTERLIGPAGRVILSNSPEARNGVHTGRGFCYFRPAAGTSPSPARETWANEDFAPTIFDLLGVPPLESFQGRSGLA